MRLERRDIYPILLLLGLTITFFHRIIFLDRFFYWRDIFRFFYPMRFFAQETIRSGQLPLWNPYLYCGMPFLADSQSAIFYPLSILFYLLPFLTAYKAYIILHFFLAGLFTYLLMREWKLERSASLLSGLIFSFSGYLLAGVEQLSILSSAIWLPLALLFFTKAIMGKGPLARLGMPGRLGGDIGFAVLSGITIALQFLAGHPEITILTILTLLFFWFFHFFSHYRKENPYFIIQALGLLIIVLTVAVFLSAVQLLPSLELLKHSDRLGGVGYQVATEWSLSPKHLITFFIPYFFGNTAQIGYWGGDVWATHFYLGILTLLLAFIALLSPHTKYRSFLLFILIISLLLSLGKYLPLHRWLYHLLPGFKMLRYPVKFLYLTTFATATLAGMGFDHLLKKKTKFLPLSLKILLAFNILLIILFLFAYLSRFQIIDLATQSLFKEKPLEFTRHYLANLRNSFHMLILFTLSLTIIITKIKDKIGLKIFQVLALTLLVIDLFAFNIQLNPVTSSDFHYIKPENIRFLEKDKEYYRIFHTPQTQRMIIERFIKETNYLDAMLKIRARLVPNTAFIYHIFDVHGYSPLKLKDFQEFLRVVEEQPLSSAKRLLSLLNVKYLFRFEELKDPAILLVKKNDLMIYQNKDCLPRAFLVPEASIIKERDRILKRLKDKDFNPMKEVILEEEPPFSNLSGFTFQKIEIIDYQANSVSIRADSDGDGFLILSDTYYPGWKVFVDGKEERIYRANYILRAVYLGKGEHLVEFTYHPFSFRLGLSVTLATILGLIILGICRFGR